MDILRIITLLVQRQVMETQLYKLYDLKLHPVSTGHFILKSNYV